jgi:hypothetical protein
MTPQDKKDPQAPLSWSASPAPKAPEPAKEPAAKKVFLNTIPDITRQESARLVGWIAAGIVAGVIVAWAGTTLLNRSGAVATNSSATTGGALQNAQTPGQGSADGFTVLSPQKAGLSVTITGTEISQPTWVAVYESRDGKPGNVLGASLFFPGQQGGTVDLLRGTVAGQTYFVTRQTDNGDHKFSLHGDPLLLENGAPVWVSFIAN